MKRVGITLLLMMAVLGPIAKVAADEAGARAIVTRHEKLAEAFAIVYAAAKTPEEREQALVQKPDPARRVASLLREMRGQERKDWVVEYYAWIFNNCPDLDDVTRVKLIHSFARHHLRSEGAGKVALALTHPATPKALEVAEAVLSKNPAPEEQGMAAVAVSELLGALSEDRAINQRRQRLLRQAIKQAAPAIVSGETTVGDLVEEQLYMMRHLQIGARAPEFEVVSVEGEPVSLEALKEAGKVTIVTFWAAEVKGSAQTAELLRDMRRALPRDKVEMIGVMPDTRDFIRKLIVDDEVTWTSVSDEEKALFYKYRTRTLPMSYVINARGEVVHVGVTNSWVQIAAEGLLK